MGAGHPCAQSRTGRRPPSDRAKETGDGDSRIGGDASRIAQHVLHEVDTTGNTLMRRQAEVSGAAAQAESAAISATSTILGPFMNDDTAAFLERRGRELLQLAKLVSDDRLSFIAVDLLNAVAHRDPAMFDDLCKALRERLN
jgi:hypothetical protein